MLRKILTTGFNIATLPARMTIRGTREMWLLPANWDRFSAELEAASREVARELETLFASVDQEMTARAAHLSPEEKQQATMLALHAAEQHLSMAARDVVRALWLSTSADRQLREEHESRLDG